MFLTIKEKAKVLAERAMKAVKYGNDLEKEMEEALKEIERAEKGSGQSGV